MTAVAVDTRIVEGMFAHLRTFSPEMTIYKPNAFSVPPGTSSPPVPPTPPYLKLSFMPAATKGYSVLASGSNIHRGILQVGVFWARGAGLPIPLEVAGAIAVHFKRNTKIWRDGTKIVIVQPPTVEVPLEEPDRLHIPVSIPYFVTTPN